MVLNKNAGGTSRLEFPNSLFNTLVGVNAGAANTTGSNTTATGVQALTSNI